MNLFEQDFQYLTDVERQEWERLQAAEVVFINGKPTIFRHPLYRDYPKAVRHYISLFPNNLLDVVDLTANKEKLRQTVELYKSVLDQSSITERTIQSFIKEHKAYFIVGAILKDNFNFGHHDLFIFPEFQLPPNFKVDYLLVGRNSGGHEFLFIEFEDVYGNITTNDGSLGEKFRKGIKQIEDWDTWLDANFSNLHLEFCRYKKKEVLLPEEFRSFDKSRIHYAVIAGRRENFTERTYKLKRKNQTDRVHLFHYDNLYDFALNVIGAPTY